MYDNVTLPTERNNDNENKVIINANSCFLPRLSLVSLSFDCRLL